ncbi:MAG: hypothetical protein ACFB0B_20880 [Thermonemataceae bacterium]
MTNTSYHIPYDYVRTLSRQHFQGLEKLNDDYLKGFWNGYHQLPKEHYEGFLSEISQQESIQQEIEVQQAHLTEVEEEIATNQVAHKALFEELKHIEHAFQYQQQIQARRSEVFYQISRDEEAYIQEKQNLRTKHSFLAGILFLIAGFIFILGDLIISHEIVAYALNIKNNMEAWSFAVGLAMVSVLLKPAYDRLIEIPYIQGNRLAKSIYIIFKIFIVGFAVATLFILGLFRYEAYKTDKIKENINQTINTLQADELDEETLAEIERESEKAKELSQQLVDSDAGLYSFILSGIMFAVAGAVCLGISFPILVAYTRIWFQIPMALRKLGKQKIPALRIIEEIEKELSEQAAKLAVKQQEVDALTPVDELKEQKRTLQDTLLALHKELQTKKLESKIFLFTDGYERGAHWAEEIEEVLEAQKEEEEYSREELLAVKQALLDKRQREAKKKAQQLKEQKLRQAALNRKKKEKEKEKASIPIEEIVVDDLINTSKEDKQEDTTTTPEAKVTTQKVTPEKANQEENTEATEVDDSDFFSSKLKDKVNKTNKRLR